MARLILFAVVFAMIFHVSVGGAPGATGVTGEKGASVLHRVSDLVKHDVSTQSTCTEVYSRAARDCRWHADLDRYTDQEILNGCHVIAYKIRWFSLKWSGWFVTGVNDIDIKFNPRARKCNGIYIKSNTMRRWWSYFHDHHHRYIKCCPRPAFRTYRRDEQ